MRNWDVGGGEGEGKRERERRERKRGKERGEEEGELTRRRWEVVVPVVAVALMGLVVVDVELVGLVFEVEADEDMLAGRRITSSSSSSASEESSSVPCVFDLQTGDECKRWNVQCVRTRTRTQKHVQYVNILSTP